MKTETLLVLTRDDLLYGHKNTPIYDLNIVYFNILREDINKASIIIFEENGETKFLKNRYSNFINN